MSQLEQQSLFSEMEHQHMQRGNLGEQKDCFEFNWLHDCECLDLSSEEQSNALNFRLFEYSLVCPEPLIDPYYVGKRERQFSSQFVDELKEAMRLLKDYHSESLSEKRQGILEKLGSMLASSDQMQYSPFVAFWKVMDMSYSVFKELENEKQKEVLKILVEEYVQTRSGFFENLDERMTDVILQVVAAALMDAGESRKKGQSFGKKLCCIVQQVFGKDKFTFAGNFNDLFLPGVVLTYDGKEGFSDIWGELKEELGLRGRKKPDFILSVGQVMIVGEAKHLKESGGGQDKQISELLSWIKNSNLSIRGKKVIYVAFLDGLYMDLILRRNERMKSAIRKVLLEGQNFFVNTAGFISLLRYLRDHQINETGAASVTPPP